MLKVSADLNSYSNVYKFNVLIKEGKGVLKFPYTSSLGDDVSLAFKKLEYMQLKTDGFSEEVKNVYRYEETRALGDMSKRETLYRSFLERVGEIRGTQIINVVSFYNYNSRAQISRELIYNVDYVIVSNSTLTRIDSARVVSLINDKMRQRGSKMTLPETLDLKDVKTYPLWLSSPDDYDAEKHDIYDGWSGLMCSSMRVQLQERKDGLTRWLIGNISNNFKIRTDTSMEVSVNPDNNVGLDKEDIFGFSEKVTQTRYRDFNEFACRGCVSSDQIITYIGSLKTDAFGVVGNLMIHMNKTLMYDKSLSFDFKYLLIDDNAIMWGSPLILIDMKRFIEMPGVVSASIVYETNKGLDKALDVDYIRITSAQAFKSGVLNQNNYNLLGIIYQGKASFENLDAYNNADYTICWRTPDTNEIDINLEVFSNSNISLGSEMYSNTSGVLIGELIVIPTGNKVVENFFS